MIELLARIFIPKRYDTSSPQVRQAYATLSGALGIVFNLTLSVLKFIVGTVSGSVAIMADAANNLSDAGSSVILLAGFRLAGKKPDAGHPYGHGRFEYLSGLIIAFLIMIVGFNLLTSSVERVITPSLPEFSIAAFIVLIASILVKFYMAFYNLGISRKIGSEAVRAVVIDSLSDVVATSAVLVCSLIAYFTSLDLDAYAGVAISLLVMYAGFDAARDNISPLLGQPPTPEFVAQIKRIVGQSDVVLGMHDLVVHNYGPGRVFITLHAEVPATGDIVAMHDEIDNLEMRLSHELNCQAVIHMDPIQNHDEGVIVLKEQVLESLADIDAIESIHDFRVVSGPTHTNVVFDVLVPIDSKVTDEEVSSEVRERVRKLGAQYRPVVNVDRDYMP